MPLVTLQYLYSLQIKGDSQKNYYYLIELQMGVTRWQWNYNKTQQGTHCEAAQQSDTVKPIHPFSITVGHTQREPWH
jgi:hypothetical protein